MKSINREAPSLNGAYCKLKQVRSKEEKDKFARVEEEEATKVMLSFGFSIFVCHCTK